ncbi:MAG: hypothetical protein Q8M31_21560 [Beijerinckiaceae bacterium]|nr:hypothetical protein [Beijerinckiaceae bacterium]
MKKTGDAGNPIRLIEGDGRLTLCVDLLEADTIDLTPGQYWHEAQVSVPGGLRDTVANGMAKSREQSSDRSPMHILALSLGGLLIAGAALFLVAAVLAAALLSP